MWLSANMCISMFRFYMRRAFTPGDGHFLTPWITGAEAHIFSIGPIAIVMTAGLADRRALLTPESSDSYMQRYAIIRHLDGLHITTSVQRIPLASRERRARRARTHPGDKGAGDNAGGLAGVTRVV